ncbi:MAG: hypothetical protein IPJ41_16480 [Phycisphaerales bacterium]|nr:hypothetical protein [Phycisphaerales bacterium]
MGHRPSSRFIHGVVLAGAGLLASRVAVAQSGEGVGAGVRMDEPRVAHLERVKVLLRGDVRAIWIGDSWCHLGRVDRVPFGAISIWPGLHVTAVSAGFKGGGGMCQAENYTSGDGQMTDVNDFNEWTVESDQNGPAHFALPLDDLTVLQGLPGLIIPQSGAAAHRLCRLRLNNVKWALTNHGLFAGADDLVMARPWFYSPASPASQVARIRFSGGTGQSVDFSPRTDARGKWAEGYNADAGTPRVPTPSQMNAVCFDVPIDAAVDLGPQLIVSEDSAWPIAGTNNWWCFGGATFYKVDAQGRRVPGYYHSGLSQDAWSITGMGEDTPSDGSKHFTDAQLRNWLDATTLDRSQTPVIVLHIATEYWKFEDLRPKIMRIIDRFRLAYEQIGGEAPRFLLVGSYMHHIPTKTIEQSREGILTTNAVYASIADSEPDCAFFSLYHTTDGVFLGSDEHGGPGTQQAARDWLNANGWSTISFGGNTYNLSSAENGGLDGIIVTDGLHIRSMPGAAFYAKMLGDAIAASGCPADFNADDTLDSRDVAAFLNAWSDADASADMNADGRIDTLDVLTFLNLWAKGC